MRTQAFQFRHWLILWLAATAAAVESKNNPQRALAKSEFSNLISSEIAAAFVEKKAVYSKRAIRTSTTHVTATSVNRVIDGTGNTALHKACLDNDFDEVRRLIELKANIEAVNQYGETPLMYACASGNIDAAQVLLAAGARVNRKDVRPQKNTALHKAAYRGQTKVVEMLLRAGADINIRNGEGRTALEMAVFQKKLGTVKLLLAQDASAMSHSQIGVSMIDIANRHSTPEITQLIREHIAKQPTLLSRSIDFIREMNATQWLVAGIILASSIVYKFMMYSLNSILKNVKKSKRQEERAQKGKAVARQQLLQNLDEPINGMRCLDLGDEVVEFKFNKSTFSFFFEGSTYEVAQDDVRGIVLGALHFIGCNARLSGKKIEVALPEDSTVNLKGYTKEIKARVEQCVKETLKYRYQTFLCTALSNEASYTRISSKVDSIEQRVNIPNNRIEALVVALKQEKSNPDTQRARQILTKQKQLLSELVPQLESLRVAAKAAYEEYKKFESQVKQSDLTESIFEELKEKHDLLKLAISAFEVASEAASATVRECSDSIRRVEMQLKRRKTAGKLSTTSPNPFLFTGSNNLASSSSSSASKKQKKSRLDKSRKSF